MHTLHCFDISFEDCKAKLCHKYYNAERKKSEEKKKRKTREIKSLIKTVLFASEYCCYSLSVFIFFVSSFLASAHCHILHCYKTHDIRSHTIWLPMRTVRMLKDARVCASACMCSNVCCVYVRFSHGWARVFSLFLTSAKRLYSVRKPQEKKLFTNKQQIKIWQKCVQIIMECKKKEASYETNAAKNKEINNLRMEKRERTNILKSAYYASSIHCEW